MFLQSIEAEKNLASYIITLGAHAQRGYSSLSVYLWRDEGLARFFFNIGF